MKLMMVGLKLPFPKRVRVPLQKKLPQLETSQEIRDFNSNQKQIRQEADIDELINMASKAMDNVPDQLIKDPVGDIRAL